MRDQTIQAIEWMLETMIETKEEVNMTYAEGIPLRIDRPRLMTFLHEQETLPDLVRALQIQVVQHHPKHRWVDGLYEPAPTRVSICTWGLGRFRRMANFTLLHELKHFFDLNEQAWQQFAVEIERLYHTRDGVVLAICLLMMGCYQAHPCWYLRALLSLIMAWSLHYLLDPLEIRANVFAWQHRHEQFFH